MTNNASAAERAASLSSAEADALCGKFRFGNMAEQERGEEKLFRLGLWKRGFLRRGESIRTPAGDAIRQHLIEQEQER